MDKILMTILVFLVLLCVACFLVMWGWSLFMVPVFGLAPLSFGQAFGFTLLTSAFRGIKSNE